MMRLICLFLTMVITVFIQASTITTYLELVLAEDGTLINDITPVTVKIVSPKDGTLWEESHEVQFFNGVAAFELGNKVEIKTYFFHEKGTQLILSVNGESISLPIYSTSFSLFSHAADIVNAIQMDGVFHTDLENERIGIALNVPTPAVRLEVNGAMRVGDDLLIDEVGTIRWRNFRLEGRHTDAWKLLDVGAEDEFESKWSDNAYAQRPAFYVDTGTNVKIATNDVRATLTVGGDVMVEKTITVNQLINAPKRVVLSDNYGVSLNSEIIARSISVDPSNYLNVTQGLVISGVLSGKGHGVTNIKSSSLKAAAIQNAELKNLSVGHQHIKAGAIGQQAIRSQVIDRSHLRADFKLTAPYLKSLIIDNSKIKPFSITTPNLAPNFEMNLYAFQPGSVVSRNIGSQNIDTSKVKDRSIKSTHFKSEFVDRSEVIAPGVFDSSHITDGSVLAEDFKPSALTFSHLNGLVPINKGGTNVNSFSITGGLMVVSNNQMISSPTFRWSGSGFGVNTAAPLGQFHIDIPTGVHPMDVSSTAAKKAGVVLKNDLGNWFLGVADDGSFKIIDQQKVSNIITIDKSLGKMSVGTALGKQHLTVGGAVLVGDTSLTSIDPGAIFFDQTDSKFKLALTTGITSLDISRDGQVASYFYVNDVDDQSQDSQVMMGNNTQLYGKEHVILASTDSVVLGNDHRLSQVDQSEVLGRSLIANGVHRSLVFSDDSYVGFTQFSHVLGADNYANQVSDSIIDGRNLQVSFANDSQVYGRDNILNHVSDSRVHGQDHLVSFSNGTVVNGDSHLIQQATHVDVSGHGHRIDFSQHVNLQGTAHRALFSTGYQAVGQQTYAAYSDGASVSGQDISVRHGGGKYAGYDLLHYGGGSPKLDGRSLILFGYHDGGEVLGQNQILFGSSSGNHLNIDDAVVFSAPGGVDIFSNDHIVAHLPANGGSWAMVSDQRIKVNVRPLNSSEILKKVMALTISEWHYKGQQYVSHIGPMAQEFYQRFQLGDSDRSIQLVDMDGVIFSSIQGLGDRFSDLSSKLKLQNQSFNAVSGQVSDLSQLKSEIDARVKLISNKDAELNHAFEKISTNEQSQTRRIKQLNQSIIELDKNIVRLKQ